MVMDRVDINASVDVEGSKLRGERLDFLRYTAVETDSHEHMLSIYAEHMLECRVCGRRFEKMPQLAGHYRMHTQASLLKALAEKLDRQNMLLEKILVELESIRKLLEELNIVEAKIEEKSVASRETVASSYQLEAAGGQGESLPSFLKKNPWVEILSKRS
jgi:DNA repair exonuclease SbcCD ATPase subunit